MRRPLGWLVVGTAFQVAMPMPDPALAQESEPAAYSPAASPPTLQPRDTAPRGPTRTEITDRLLQLDRRIAEIDAALEGAHFRTVLALTRRTLARLDAEAPLPHSNVRRARLELMAATAQIALARRDEARQSLTRALRADPTLALDASTASPKVLKLMREVRMKTGIEESKR